MVMKPVSSMARRYLLIADCRMRILDKQFEIRNSKSEIRKPNNDTGIVALAVAEGPYFLSRRSVYRTQIIQDDQNLSRAFVKKFTNFCVNVSIIKFQL